MRQPILAFGASVLCVFLLLVSAAAGELGGVRMPDRISVAGKALQLNGMGIREATVLNIDVYVAGLYLEQRSSDPARVIASPQTKRLVLRFVRDVERDDIAEAYREGFEKNVGQAAAKKLEPRIDQLIAWMPDMQEGQTLVFTFLPDAGVQVAVNGQNKGTIAGMDFARAMLSVWLGPHPPNSGLKQGLLGKS